jgi:nucleoside diphosphate kinase
MNFEKKSDNSVEARENMPKNEIAFAFIKPDFIEDLPEIEKILETHGLEIIYRALVRLNEDAVDHIYKESKKEHFFDAMKKYLTTHDAIALLVGGKEMEAQKILSGLKKDGEKDGIIREKFQKNPRMSEEELSLWEKGEHPHQDEISVLLTQKNVIHTADNTEEALESLRLILGRKFDELKARGTLPSELWEIFDEENKPEDNNRI